MQRYLIPLALAALVTACQPPAPAPAPAGPSTSAPASSSDEPLPVDKAPGRFGEDYSYLLGKGETPEPGKTLLRHSESDLKTINPILFTQESEHWVFHHIFEPLYLYDGNLKITPILAEGMPELDATGTVYTVHIKKGVTWHDGQPLTASDVKFTVDMILNPDVPALNVRSNFDLLRACEVVDDHTVKFIWKQRYAPAADNLVAFYPIPEHVYKVAKLTDFASQPANRSPIGSGPWKFVEWKTGQSITLAPYPDYYGEKAHFDKILFKVIENREVALKACASGELDEQRVPTTKWLTEAAKPSFLANFNRAMYYDNSFNYVNFNTKSKKFADARVRRALSMALDRWSLVRDLYKGLARVTSGPFNQDTEWYDKTVEPLPFDLEGAAKLLDEAGWKDSDGDGVRDKGGTPLAIELSFPAGNIISEQMGALWQESAGRIGVKIEMRGMEGASFFDKLSKGEFECSPQAWTLDVDPDWAYALYHSSQAPPVGINHGFCADPELDKLLVAQRTELDHAKRVEIIHQIHRRLRDQAPYIYTIQVPDKRVFRKTLRGIEICPIGPYRPTPRPAHWFPVRAAGVAQ